MSRATNKIVDIVSIPRLSGGQTYVGSDGGNVDVRLNHQLYALTEIGDVWRRHRNSWIKLPELYPAIIKIAALDSILIALQSGGLLYSLGRDTWELMPTIDESINAESIAAERKQQLWDADLAAGRCPRGYVQHQYWHTQNNAGELTEERCNYCNMTRSEIEQLTSQK